MNINTVLFDLDGVLVDACNWHYLALNAALKDFGIKEINKKDHISIYNGLPTKVKLKMLGIAENLIDEINKCKQIHTMDIIRKNAKIMPEKIKLHKFLKDNSIKIACVTNSIRETATEMLQITGQYEYMDVLISNEDVKRNKPYPDCYNLALKKLKANPMQSICVEDSPKGIEAAIKSLAKSVWVVNNPSEVTMKNFIQFAENTQ